MLRFRWCLVLVSCAAALFLAPTASASSVSNANVTLTESGNLTPVTQVEAGAQGGLYVWFTVATATGGGNTVTITGPAGTVFGAGLASGNNTMTDETDTPGSFSNASVLDIGDDGRSVTLEVPNAVAVEAGEVLGVRLSLVSSHISFGTTAGPKTMKVQTNHDTTPADTSVYTILAGPPEAMAPANSPQSTARDQLFDPLRVAVSDQYGNPVEGAEVVATAPATGPSGTFPGDEDQVTVVTGANGEAALSDLRANGELGAWTLNLEGPGALTADFGLENLEHTEAAQVALALSPATVPADGATKLTATATITDEFGNPVPGDQVTFSSTGAQAVGPVVDQGDGRYSATITASIAPGQSTITATDDTPPTPVSGTAGLTQTSTTPGPPGGNPNPPGRNPDPPGNVVKPRLKFVKPPKKRVSRAKVKVRFRVVVGRATGFQCRLNRQRWKRCKSPANVKLKRGKNVFRVRGIAADGTAGKPIVRKIRRVAKLR